MIFKKETIGEKKLYLMYLKLLNKTFIVVKHLFI